MRPRGGVIGANVTPTQSAASGVWTLREAEAYARAGAWPALPGAPTSVSGTAGNAQVSVTWTAPSATGGYAITDYTVQYSSNSGSSWTTFSRAASSATSATVTGLTNGTAYTFRVAAVTVLGSGAYSTASSSVTPSASSFSPTAVLLTSGTTYTVPSGATTMKAWAAGGGGGAGYLSSVGGQAGGCAFKTWSVTGGQTISYSVAAAPSSGTADPTGGDSTVTFSGSTITGQGGTSSYNNASPRGSYSGGDGGATGGMPNNNVSAGSPSRLSARGGAVGGNSAPLASCGRRPMTDVSGLIAALQLAGANTNETCAATAAFGSGGLGGKFVDFPAGRCGGTGASPGGAWAYATGGAVVLYFT